LCEIIHEKLKELQEISWEPIVEKMIDMTSSYKEFIDEKSKIKILQNEINEVIKIVEAPENLDEMKIEERQIQYELMKNELKKKKAFFYTEVTKKLEVDEDKTEELCTENCEEIIEKKSKDDTFYREVMNNFFKVTNSFGPHLFEYILVRCMPATNNSTEQFFGKVRTKLRRITGRQNNNALIITRGDYIALTLNCNSYEDIKKRISNVSYDDYKIEKEKCSKINCNYRIQSKVKKDPLGYLNMLVFGWKQVVTGKI